MRYLLDTNILSDLVRHPTGAAASRMRQIGEDAACTSIIAAAELRYGAVRRQSPRLTSQVTGLLANIEVLAFEPPMDETYADIRTALERQGQTIGNNDMLIAAQALYLGYTLVTDNVREFQRVDGLVVENWVR